MLIASHTILNALPGGSVTDIGYAPPTEFKIFSFGQTGTSKGDFDFTDADADACMSVYADQGNRLTIDYEHMALANPPVIAPAAASFVIEKRNDGLWATDIHWSPKATEMLRNKEYLYFSPAFVADEGHPKRLLNLALTNIPATKNMAPLVAANLIEEPMMKTVLSALQLKETANEAEALNAVVKLNDEHRRLLSATGKDSIDEAIGAVVALKAQAERAEQLSAELSAVRAEKAQAEMQGLLDEAVKDGRVSPQKRASLEALYAESGIKALRTCLDMLPRAAAVVLPPVEKAPAAAGQELSAAELKVIKNTGLSPEKFIAHKAKYRNAINPTEEI